MSIQTTIDLLQSANSPARNLDLAIAELVGWQKATKVIPDSAGGEDRKTEVWFLPSGKEGARVPSYTSNMQHAFELAQSIAPYMAIGYSWEDAKGSARIDDGPYIQSVNPQIALCIAALMELQKSTED